MRTKIVDDVKRDTLIKVVTRHVAPGTTGSTDELLSYRTVSAHGYMRVAPFAIALGSG